MLVFVYWVCVLLCGWMLCRRRSRVRFARVDGVRVGAALLLAVWVVV